jgi:ABC-type nitrate/sulfonate/bicarbonate transport system substrate-binding protein
MTSQCKRSDRASSPTRRRLLAGIAGSALIAPSFRSLAATALEQPKFEAIAIRDPQIGAQVAVAETYGLWRDEGLDVTIRWLQTAADTMPLMASNSEPIAFTNSFAQVVLGSRKLPVKTISKLADISGTQGFALSPGVHLSNPKELEGKRLAYTQGTPQILLIGKLAKLYGFNMDKVHFVNMNQSEGVVAASKGDVDGLIGWQPNLYRVVKMGGTLYSTLNTLYVTGKAEPMPTQYPLSVYSSLIVQQDWIDTKPNTLKALLRVLIKANVMLNNDRAKAFEAVHKVMRIDADALEVMMTANQYGLGISPDLAVGHQTLTDWALSNGRITGASSPEEVFSTQIAAAVDPKLVTWHPKK